jgi:hypothetical protein
MIDDRAEYYRREAQKCLQQAERAPDVWMKDHMRLLADKWLEMAASHAREAESAGTRPHPAAGAKST